MKKRILIVDDEIILANNIADMLLFMNFESDIFTDSELAYKQFESNQDLYSLILTDHSMPNLSGAELAMKIKVISPDIPVILATGYDLNSRIIKNITHLFDAMLNKPFQIDDIKKLLNELIK